ncbi:hypothetical protein CHH58_16020 [Terribacillus saccharophilus]|uniref:hypothetical protein n=1 Tax=Terribacillus saccharophilus TaxID=361277 RepID=UPI000BA77097|nr:hypothetical protein [Terribacillus saccharophilus]PAF35562.1 hypothetical protein CHH58_16020 [Terribacillus saccharophilus]
MLASQIMPLPSSTKSKFTKETKDSRSTFPVVYPKQLIEEFNSSYVWSTPDLVEHKIESSLRSLLIKETLQSHAEVTSLIEKYKKLNDEINRYTATYNDILGISAGFFKNPDNPSITLEQAREFARNEQKKHENVQLINSFRNLKYDWNNNGAEPFRSGLLDITIDLVKRLDVQPDVFPTARDSIQFEYEDDEIYLEFEIFEDRAEIFVDNNGNEYEEVIENPRDYKEFNRIIKRLVKF